MAFGHHFFLNFRQKFAADSTNFFIKNGGLRPPFFIKKFELHGARLLATSIFLLATSVFLLATSVFLLVTSVFLLATSVFLLATSVFLLATSVFLLVTSVFPYKYSRKE